MDSGQSLFRYILMIIFIFHGISYCQSSPLSGMTGYDLPGCGSLEMILPEACGVEQKLGEARPFSEVPDHVILLHTLEKPCDGLFECCRAIDAIRKYHVTELGWPNIGFNFLVGNDGRVYVGRGPKTTGHFSLRYNGRALAVAFIGNFYAQSPTGKALQAVKQLLKCSVYKGHLSKHYTLHTQEDVECTRNPAPGLRRNVTRWWHYAGRVKDYVRC